ncbi:MAG TPA: hypothetical protein VH328_17035 [Burkholderiaceae bacterium]|nr:hypothetical protein [Burkholderiaceae bacterium]
MKVRLVSLAAMAVVGSAHALSPAQIDADRSNGTLKEIVIHGGSAQAPLFGAYAVSICNSDIDVYFNSGGSGTGKDYRAYACTLKATIKGSYSAGTPILLTKRDLGGSIYGVNPIAEQNKQNTMSVDSTAGNCVTTGQQAGATTPSYTCANFALEQANAGISDVEPTIFSSVMTVGNTKTAINLPSGSDDSGNAWKTLTAKQLKVLNVGGANQTIFGVGVSTPLRNAMQQAQGLNVGSEAPADVPSMPRAFYSAAVSGFVKASTANHAGWDALTGNTADNALQVNICRRANGSGTQASSNLLFLNAGTLDTTAGGGLAPLVANGVAVAVSGAPIAVIENTSTGTAISCLTGASSLGAYAVGIISFENDPGTSAWRFVKLDGQVPSQPTARVGGYPYVYEASIQWLNKGNGAPTGQLLGFLENLRVTLGSPAGIAALSDPAAKRGVLAPPSNYTGTCASQAPGSNNQLYGSCVERLDTTSAYNSGKLVYTTKPYETNSNQDLHIVK